MVKVKHRHGFWHPTDLVQALPHAGSVAEADCNCRAETTLADMTAVSTAANHIFFIIVRSSFICCIAAQAAGLLAGTRPWAVR